MAITRGDEYPLHQSSRPVRHPGTDRNLYDRFFFNGYSPDLGTYFAVAFGQYVGRNVMDGALSVSLLEGGERVQHDVHVSRLLGADRLDTSCVGLRIEILEPLQSLRVTLDDPSGLRAELVYTAVAHPFEEANYRNSQGYRLVFDVTRMTQNGTWNGWIDVPGHERLAVADWWGGRDRSWGIRPCGEPDPPGAPDGGGMPQYYWLWAPMRVGDTCYLFDVNEYADGKRWHESAMAVPVGGTEADIEVGTVRYEMPYVPGTRHASGFTCSMDLPRSGQVDFDLELLYPFLMKGIGYTHPDWQHGRWKGPAERLYETYSVDQADVTQFPNLHIQAVAKVRRGDGAEGIGILEQLVIGPHAPSGFTSILDTAP